MKILERKSIPPISLLPGDTLSCVYTDVKGKRHELATHEATEVQTIDTTLIAELDESNLKALGLKSGLAGIFGESDDELFG